MHSISFSQWDPGVITMLSLLKDTNVASLAYLGVWYYSDSAANQLMKLIPRFRNLRTIAFGRWDEDTSNTDRALCKVIATSCFRLEELYLYRWGRDNTQTVATALREALDELTDNQRQMLQWKQIGTLHFRDSIKVDLSSQFLDVVPSLLNHLNNN